MEARLGELTFQHALDMALAAAAIRTLEVHNRHGRVAVASLEDFGLIEPVDSDQSP